MHILTREQLIAAQDRRFKVVEVPGLGGAVRIASLSAGGAMKCQALEARREVIDALVEVKLRA